MGQADIERNAIKVAMKSRKIFETLQSSRRENRKCVCVIINVIETRFHIIGHILNPYH